MANSQGAPAAQIGGLSLPRKPLSVDEAVWPLGSADRGYSSPVKVDQSVWQSLVDACRCRTSDDLAECSG